MEHIINYKCTAYNFGIHIVTADVNRAVWIADMIGQMGLHVSKVDVQKEYGFASIVILTPEADERMPELNKLLESIVKQPKNE